MVDLVLELRGFVGRLVGVVRHQLVVAVDDRLLLGDPFLDVAEDGLGGIELRLLGQEADRRPLRRERLAGELVVLAGHDAQQRRLAGAVVAQHADLRAVIEREPDPLQDLPLGRDGLSKVLHREDELGHRAILSSFEIEK
jgi:hypothetical protein